MSLNHSLLAAQGYLELEMMDEALHELETLTESERNLAEVLHMRLFIMMRLQRWEEAVTAAGKLRGVCPEGSDGYIQGAFCLHEMGRTEEARMLLLESPAALRDEPTFHYNLACYEAVLGNVQDATKHLQTSFRMDHHFRELAKADPDLEPVRDFLES